ncbi:hypothetical protein BP5796_09484 [Coleophoma crateriformis]|uniref:Uncharacterized protein n=1 Tax=Coleophoma crateriformis TaxID=565419 RepID=A0A3D8QYA0_9HELO|nr:hypothetical protein BP5796_09484 [Coleophoma crateriformis]
MEICESRLPAAPSGQQQKQLVKKDKSPNMKEFMGQQAFGPENETVSIPSAVGEQHQCEDESQRSQDPAEVQEEQWTEIVREDIAALTAQEPRMSDFEVYALTLPVEALSQMDARTLANTIIWLRGLRNAEHQVTGQNIERPSVPYENLQDMQNTLQRHVLHIQNLNGSLLVKDSEWLARETELNNELNRLQDEWSHERAQHTQYKEQVFHEKQKREEKHRAEYNQIVDMYKDAQTKLSRAEKESRQIRNVLLNTQKADCHRLDESYFREGLQDLRWSIRNWSRSQDLPLSCESSNIALEAYRKLKGLGPGAPRSAAKPMYHFLSAITAKYAEYTASAEMFPWLLQAYVWNVLWSCVVDKDLWAGSLHVMKGEEPDMSSVLVARSYGSLNEYFKPARDSPSEEHDEFHEWRSITSRMLCKNSTSEVLARAVDQVRSQVLSPFLDQFPDDALDFDILELDTIIEKVIELSAAMARQRCFFRLNFVEQKEEPEARFAPDRMCAVGDLSEIDERRERRYAVLTVSPGLLKVGTSEGTRFDVVSLVERPEVLTRVHSFSRHS